MTGVIAGAILQTARRTAGLTQEGLAEAAGHSVDTIKRWESGQRPLGRVKAVELAKVQRQLRTLGARPSLVARMQTAVEADAFLAQATTGDGGPLGEEVVTREWSSLVGWALTGEPIGVAADVASHRPLLGTADRCAVLAATREAAAQAAATDTNCLLRHQAYFLAAMDTSTEGSAWLAAAARTERSRKRLGEKWSPDWAVARSLAVSLARQGDPEPLRWFIGRHMTDAECEEANLSYWAYWTAEDPEPALAEEFMIERPMDTTRAAALLRHLSVNLSPTAWPDAELSIAAVTSLARRWPDLLHCDKPLAVDLAARAGKMLDSKALGEVTLSPAARLALSDLHAAARSAANDPRRQP